MPTTNSRIVATFSIVARDMQNGDLGVAVQSKFLAVGSVVPWASANAGAIATQAMANISYGPDGLRMLADGMSAADALEHLLANDDGRDHRQIGIVDRAGSAVAFTGSACHNWAGHRTGDGYACQGNILAGAVVVDAMAETFERSSGELAERLVAALSAGQTAGGDRRGRQSAALYVAREGGSYGGLLDRYVDLRVDDHPDPIVELERVLGLHRFYLTRPAADAYVPIDATIARELQDALRDLGYYVGETTGMYDDATHEALANYGGVENLEERLVEDARIDRAVLLFIRDKRAGR